MLKFGFSSFSENKYIQVHKGETEFYYEGFVFIIKNCGDDCFSASIFLADKSLYFWDYSVREAPSFAEALKEAKANCEFICKDFGVSPIGFDPVELPFLVSTEWP